MPARFGFKDAFGTTFGTVFRNLPAYLATQGVVLFFIFLVVAVLFLTLGLGGFLLLKEGNEALGLAALLAFGACMLPILVVYVASLGIGIHVADAALRGERIGLARAWELTRPRLGNMTLTVLLLVLFLGCLGVVVAFVHSALGFLVLVVLAPAAVVALYLLLTRWALALPLSAFHDHGPRLNLRVSSALTRGSRWPIAAILVLLHVLPQVLGSAANTVPFLAAMPLATAQGEALLWPFVVAGLVVGYVMFALEQFCFVTLAVAAYRRLQPAPPPPLVGFEVLPDDEPAFTL